MPYKTIKKPKVRTSPKKKDEAESDEETAELVTCDENHIYFYDWVNSKSILTLIKYIKTVNTKLKGIKTDIEAKYGSDVNFNIYLHINSCGGYMTDAFAALDCIKKSEFPIVSIVEGYAASAATFLSIVCHKRQITSYSSMLIHELSSVSVGTFEQLEDDHANNNYLLDSMKKLYTTHSKGKLNNKILEKILKHDLMWSAQRCLQYGLVDEIL